MSVLLKLITSITELDRLRFKIYDGETLLHTTGYFEDDVNVWFHDNKVYISIDDIIGSTTYDLSVSILHENNHETNKSNAIEVATGASKVWTEIWHDDFSNDVGHVVPAFSSNLVLNSGVLEVDRGGAYPICAINYAFVIGKYYRLEVSAEDCEKPIQVSYTFNGYPRKVITDFPKVDRLDFRYGENPISTYKCAIGSIDNLGGVMKFNYMKLYELI